MVVLFVVLIDIYCNCDNRQPFYRLKMEETLGPLNYIQFNFHSSYHMACLLFWRIERRLFRQSFAAIYLGTVLIFVEGSPPRIVLQPKYISVN